MKAGRQPRPGASRMTIRAYRIGPDGQRVDERRLLAVQPGDAEILPVPLVWPPCRCPRCHAGGVPG